MEIGEIISDAIKYPLNNMKALLIYIVLSIIMALVLVFSGVGLISATEVSGAAAGGLGIGGIIGIIIALCIYLLILGYMLDVIKFGIARDEGSPEIDIGRQIINGIKYIILGIVYFIIPIIIIMVLSRWETLAVILGLILFIVFGLAFLMAACKLAETESLGAALNIGESIKTITKVGIAKILAIIIVFVVLAIIVGIIVGIFGNDGFLGVIGGIINGICSVYLTFFYNRAIGLAYSDA